MSAHEMHLRHLSAELSHVAKFVPMLKWGAQSINVGEFLQSVLSRYALETERSDEQIQYAAIDLLDGKFWCDASHAERRLFHEFQKSGVMTVDAHGQMRSTERQK